MEDDIHDELPADLDVTGYVGPYTFPNINRRRVPGFLYLAIGVVFVALWAANARAEHVLVNIGFLGGGLFLALVGLYHVGAAWNLAIDDSEALVSAVRRIGFPVGHASAQLGWRGLRSRPTWRILLYSAEDPPQRRGMVMVDGVDAEVLAQLIEDNPEDWAALGG